MKAMTGSVLVLLCMATGMGCQTGPQPGEETGGAANTEAAVNLRAGLPPGVQMVGQHSDTPTWRVSERGIVYIYNQTNNQLVGQVFVREGQELVVSGPEGRATLDGNEVAVGKLVRGRTYGLYFLPTAEAGASAQDQGNLFRITPASGS